MELKDDKKKKKPSIKSNLECSEIKNIIMFSTLTVFKVHIKGKMKLI
jgi:hypothetical protein